MINKSILIWLLTAVLGSALTLMIMVSGGQVGNGEGGETYMLFLIFSGLFSLPAIPILIANFYFFKRIEDSLPKIALILVAVALANVISMAVFYVVFELSYELFSILSSYTITSFMVAIIVSWRKITMSQQLEDYFKETSSIEE